MVHFFSIFCPLSLLYLFITVALIIGSSSNDSLYDMYNFRDSCDIHTINPGHQTPPTVLPQEATESWLFEPIEEIQKWYEIGKQDCSAQWSLTNITFSQNHAPFYTDQTTYSRPQIRCRGRDTLLDFTGKVIIPFGPYKTCPTYSKCWFGLISCGEVKKDEIEKQIRVQLQSYFKLNKNIKPKYPVFKNWSIKGLHVLINLVGPELVVPEQRYLKLKDKHGLIEEVLIVQYRISRPYDNYQLYMRLFELYIGLFFDWPVDFNPQRAINTAVLFLGGSENRCQPWQKCYTRNTCCGCDEQSFVGKTPVLLTSPDNSTRCVGLKERPLPVCSGKNSSYPGRWVLSNDLRYGPGCDKNDEKYKIFQNVKSRKNEDILDLNKTVLRNVSEKVNKWYEASGDPCYLVTPSVPEEMNVRNWFYSPYTCKYHFYNPKEAKKCFKDLDVKHIHFQGDSMARDLFGHFCKFLGIKEISEEGLKARTNKLNANKIQFNSDELLMSIGYSWNFDLKVLEISEKPPYPDVLVTNGAFAHRILHQHEFEAEINKTDFLYWTKKRTKNQPKYRIFMNAAQLQGVRNSFWSGNLFRRNSDFLRKMYEKLGFWTLDEFLLTEGKIEFISRPETDGWHYYGLKRQMAVIVIINMVCNDWLQRKKIS